MTKLITPNWHVILIHYPMALLTLGVFIEFFSFLWKRSSFRAAGRWMILIGTLMAVPAVTTGIYAFRDAVSQEPGGTWSEVSARSNLSSVAWEMMRAHLLYMSIATGLFIIVVVTWVGSSDRLRTRLHIPLMILLLLGTAILMRAAWHAGEATYREGVAQQPDGPGAYPAMRNPADPSDDGLVASPPTTWLQRAEWVSPPIQAHALSAGFVISFAILALALSLRKWSTNFIGPPEAEDWFNTSERPTGPVVADAKAPIARAEQNRIIAGDPALPGIVPTIHTPASRFWILAFVLALGTMAGGLWVADNWTWPGIRSDFNEFPRDRWHIIFGIAIVVLPLLLAGATRWLSRSRLLLLLLSLLLAVAIAGQLWIAVLLVYDGKDKDSPLTRFTPTIKALPVSVPSTRP